MSNILDYEINKELGECYLLIGEYDKAQNYYLQAVESNKKMTDPYLGLAAIALHRGEIEEAYAYYSTANVFCESDKTLAGMAMIEVEKQNYEMAFANYAKALEHNSVNMLALNGFVQVSHLLQRLEEVLPYLEKALATLEDENIRYALAGCLFALGRVEESRVHLEVLLGHNPNNHDVQQLYANITA